MEEVGKGPGLWPYPSLVKLRGGAPHSPRWPRPVARSPSVHPAVQSRPVAVLVPWVPGAARERGEAARSPLPACSVPSCSERESCRQQNGGGGRAGGWVLREALPLLVAHQPLKPEVRAMTAPSRHVVGQAAAISLPSLHPMHPRMKSRSLLCFCYFDF